MKGILPLVRMSAVIPDDFAQTKDWRTIYEQLAALGCVEGGIASQAATPS